MAAPHSSSSSSSSSRTSSRSTSAGPGIHSPGATAASSFYRASSGYSARSSHASSPCPHHHHAQQHQYSSHHHAPSSHTRHHASSFANLGGSYHHYPSSHASSAFASSTSSSFSSRSAVPSLFHHQHHSQRHASPTRVNLVTGGVASSAANPSVRFSLDSRSISPHSRPIAVAPSARRDHLHGQPPQHPHHHYHHNHHSHHHDAHPHLHHHHHTGHHHQAASGGGGGYSRPISASGVGASQHAHAPPRRTCMCSPTTHPGSFRCALHKAAAAASFGGSGASSYSSPSNRLNARRSAMTNSLVRIGTVEGDLVKRALAALIRPSSHQLRRRAAFQPRPSRLSVMSCARDVDACAAA